MEQARNAERWRTALDELGVWKRGEERAVHKPLLVFLLLARAARHEAGEITFASIDEPLTRLLREFGPPRRSHHPEYPFWYLQNDGFWVVREAERHPLKTGGGSPTRRTLIDGDATAFVVPELWSEIVVNSALRVELARKLLDSFWPQSLHGPLLEAVGLEVRATETRERPARAADFRRDLLAAYERKCAVCGYDGRLSGEDFGLEGAHIRWHCYQGPDEVRNGVLLCSFHHVALDRGAIGLVDDCTVVVSKHVSGGEPVEDWLGRFHARSLVGPRDPADLPAPEFIAWHQREVFRKPARALPRSRPTAP